MFNKLIIGVVMDRCPYNVCRIYLKSQNCFTLMDFNILYTQYTLYRGFSVSMTQQLALTVLNRLSAPVDPVIGGLYLLAEPIIKELIASAQPSWKGKERRLCSAIMSL